jgi:manganese oxidase
MKTPCNARWMLGLAVAAAGLLFRPGTAAATIIGVVQPGGAATFNLMAKADTISTGDGDSMWMWGFAACESSVSCANRMQYPGPTLIVDQGATVTVNLRNQLPLAASILFPGFTVTATGGVAGLLTNEAAAAAPGTTTGGVTYTFTASRPGTYGYFSGSRPDLEVEMGMLGAIIVRPAGYSATATPSSGACQTNATLCSKAYGDVSTAYDREYLFVVSEADPLIHQQVAAATFGSNALATIQTGLAAVDMSKRRAVDWFFNGRNFPDTVTPPNPPANQSGYPSGLPAAGWLPTQPYNTFPQMYPGEKVLIRSVGGGLDLHPIHTHGQNHLVVARDSRVLSTLPASAAPPADLAVSDYTTTSIPGGTFDAIWGPWTGERLGWDVYGHTDPAGLNRTGAGCTAALAPTEYLADHCKPFPVQLPAESNVTYGQFNGGTPYLGVPADLPPLNPDGTVHVDQNPLAGQGFMWHSHSERELTTNDVFIGGAATMSLVLPPPSICPSGLNCNIW